MASKASTENFQGKPNENFSFEFEVEKFIFGQKSFSTFESHERSEKDEFFGEGEKRDLVTETSSDNCFPFSSKFILQND